jgi:hypothetical protein
MAEQKAPVWSQPKTNQSSVSSIKSIMGVRKRCPWSSSLPCERKEDQERMTLGLERGGRHPSSPQDPACLALRSPAPPHVVGCHSREGATRTLRDSASPEGEPQPRWTRNSPSCATPDPSHPNPRRAPVALPRPEVEHGPPWLALQCSTRREESRDERPCARCARSNGRERRGS